MLKCSLEMTVSVSCTDTGPGHNKQAMSTYGSAVSWWN